MDKNTLAKIVAGILVGLLLGVAIGYYGLGPTTTTSTSEPDYTFYGIGWTLQDPWLAAFTAGMDAAGGMTNSKTVMIESGGGAEGFTTGFEQALAARPDGILIGYWFPEAMGSAFQRAKELGIPIVTFDVQAPPDMGISIGFVGWSNLEVGGILAKRVTQGFTPSGCAIISHDVGQLWSIQRSQGITDYFEENFPGVPVEVVDNKVVQTSETQSVELLRSYRTAHPDVDVYLALGPNDADAVISFVQEQNLAGVVKTGSVDISERIVNAIKDGEMIAAVSQQPYFQGFIGTQWLYNYNVYGFIPPEKTATGPTLVDINTVDKIIQQLETTGAA